MGPLDDILTPSIFRTTEIDSGMYLGDPSTSVYHVDSTAFLFNQSAPFDALGMAAPCAGVPVGPSADDDFSVFEAFLQQRFFDIFGI